VTFLVILAESVGALCLILGLATRFMAASIGLVMLGAIYYVVGQWGFFMNWYSQPQGEGYEFHLLVLGVVIALILGGGGKWSLDRLLIARLDR
jgi:putative oxidoreductase